MSVHTCGTGVVPHSQVRMGGTPFSGLDRGYPIPGLDGGHPIPGLWYPPCPGQVPGQDRNPLPSGLDGVLPRMGLDGVPLPLGLDWGPPSRTGWIAPPHPSIRRQSSIASTCYVTGSMPLAITQNDFLV